MSQIYIFINTLLCNKLQNEKYLSFTMVKLQHAKFSDGPKYVYVVPQFWDFHEMTENRIHTT